MKPRYLLSFLLLLFSVTVSTAQPCTNCEVKNISTDPRNPQNCEKILKFPIQGVPQEYYAPLNRFFWFPVENDLNQEFNLHISGSNPSLTVPSPFWTEADGPIIGEHANREQSDFWPEDGWEVIKVNFGRLADDSSFRYEYFSMGYMIFYNKYTGIMRFLGVMPRTQFSWETITFKMEILPKKLRSYQDFLDASSVLSIQGNTVQPLDQQTQETSYEVVTQFPGKGRKDRFFWFDIPLAYDPCICNNDVAFQFVPEFYPSWNLELTHKFSGNPLQKTEQDSDGFSRLSVNRIIGGSSLLPPDIAMQNSVVQSSRYADFLAIIKNIPQLNKDDKVKLMLLQDLMNGSEVIDFDEVSKEWVKSSTGESFGSEDWKYFIVAMNKYLTGPFDFHDQRGGGSKITTSVAGNLHAEGTVSKYSGIGWGQVFYYGMPGSKMNKDLNEQMRFTGPQLLNPEYPLYNEVLGTFALLKTPTIKVKPGEVEACDLRRKKLGGKYEYGESRHKVYDVFLDEDILYYLNPATNPNLQNTKISVSLVADLGDSRLYDKNALYADPDNSTLTGCGKSSQTAQELVRSYNLVKDVEGVNYMTLPVPIDQFRELMVRMVLEEDVNAPRHSGAGDFKFYLRFLIEFESENNGKDGKPARTTQVFTFPVNVEKTSQNLPFQLIDIAGSDEEVVYADTTFAAGQPVIFHRGPVKITGNLASSGTTVKIYSLTGFSAGPPASIGSGIQLITGYPFEKIHPQPMRNKAFVNDFCTGKIPGLQYRANQWATETNTPTIPTAVSGELNLKLYPNPSSGWVKFEVEMDHWQKPVLIEIFSVTGQPLYSQKFDAIISGTPQLIDVSALKVGTYIVKCTDTENKTSQVQKLVLIR